MFKPLSLFIGFRYTRACLLYTSDAADDGGGVDLGGRRIIKNMKFHYAQGYLYGKPSQQPVKLPAKLPS